MLVAALIGALMLNPPILEIFAGAATTGPFGWPVVVFYINLIWLLLILLVVSPKIWRLLRQTWHSLTRTSGQGRD